MRRSQLFCVLLVTCTLSRPTRAWEADVHYGLTNWLAQQAGLSKDQAGAIAKVDLQTDDSSLTDPLHGTLFLACFSKQDSVGSGIVQFNHFPSRGVSGDPANARIVNPDRGWFQGNSRKLPTVAIWTPNE